MDEYKIILELQLLLLNKDLLKTPFRDRTAKGFLFEVQSRISAGTYHKYHRLDEALTDIAWFEILKREINYDLATSYIDDLVNYIVESIRQAELKYIGEQVTDALTGNNFSAPVTRDDDDDIFGSFS